MDEEPGLIESLRELFGVIGDTLLFLSALAVGVALVAFGNTNARVIGLCLLAVWLYFALRLARRRFADRRAKLS